LIGGLAALAFARAAGIALLGEPRSEAARAAREPSPWMTFPALALGVAVAFLGLAPFAGARALGAAAAQLSPAVGEAFPEVAVALRPVGVAAAVLWAVALALWLALRARVRAPAPAQLTWDCGY